MNYFQDIDMFSDLSIDDQERLSGFCQLRRIYSNDFLFHQGDDATSMYFILEGEFAIIKDSMQVSILNPGDILGEIAFLDDSKSRNASVKCIEDGGVITMIKYAMDEILAKYPQLHADIQKIIEKRIK